RHSGGSLSSSPVYSEGMVYVTEGQSQDTATLLAFPAKCRADGGTCAPQWTASGMGEPVVSGGMVYVEGGRGLDAALAYRVGCQTQADRCDPSRVYQGGADQPVVSGGVLYSANGGKVFAYDLGCTARTCRPVWSGTVG